jgi:hypothetical protein
MSFEYSAERSVVVANEIFWGAVPWKRFRDQARQPVKQVRGLAPVEASSDAERPTAWLGRQDSNLCISDSEFTKTLSSGREDSNMRISLASWSCRPSLLRKSQTMAQASGSDSEMQRIAVGTLITERPPHRTVRAQFGHTAPALGV